MIFLLGYEDDKLTYMFKLKSEEMASKYINTFSQLGVKMERATAAQFAEAERQQEKKIWG